MVLPWAPMNFHGLIVIAHGVSRGSRMGIRLAPMDFHECPHEVPMVFPWTSMGSYRFPWNPMGLPLQHTLPPMGRHRRSWVTDVSPMNAHGLAGITRGCSWVGSNSPWISHTPDHTRLFWRRFVVKLSEENKFNKDDII